MPSSRSAEHAHAEVWLDGGFGFEFGANLDHKLGNSLFSLVGAEAEFDGGPAEITSASASSSAVVATTRAHAWCLDCPLGGPVLGFSASLRLR